MKVIFFFKNLHLIHLIGRRLVISMLEKDPEKRISLPNILTHKFVIKHYMNEEGKEKNKQKKEELEEFKLENSEEKNGEIKKERKKNNWKKSVTHQNDHIVFDNLDGSTNTLDNNFNSKFKKHAHEAKSSKSFGTKFNLMPPSKYEYSKLGSNKMINDSKIFDALENRDQLKSVKLMNLSF